MKESCVLKRGGVSQRSNLDFHSGLAESLGAARRQRIGIAHGGDDPGHTRADDRVGARRLLALMRAGLEGDDQRRPSSPLAGVGQRHRFGVPITVLRMPSFAYQLTVPEYDRSHQRILLDLSPTPPGEVEGTGHCLPLVHSSARSPLAGRGRRRTSPC